MIRMIFVFMLVVVTACGNAVSADDISKINGYWEIEKVVFEDGAEKGYTISETIDFFEIKGNSGIRKKMKPQFDGSYAESGHAEKIKIDFGKSATVHYATEFAKWKEEIVELGDDVLVLKNDRNMEYHYKRHIPFNIK